jgi:hypothetical protein
MMERRAGLVVLALAAALVVRATVAPHPSGAGIAPPWCFLCEPHAGIDVLLNVLLFIPLGFGLRLAGLSRRIALAVAAASAIVIELLQFLVVSGRAASAHDVVANALGGGVGIAMGAHWRALVVPQPALALRLTTAAVLGWLAVLLATAVLMSPAPRTTPERLRAAPPDADSRFDGGVVAVSVDGVPAPANGGAAGTALRGHAGGDTRLEAIVTPGAQQAQPTPIVEVIDGRGRRVLVLEQHLDGVTFIVRRRATAARFRTPNIGLFAALPPSRGDESPSADTVRLAGWTERFRMYLSARSRHQRGTRMLELRPTLGWALLLPFEYTYWPVSRRFTAIWLGLLALPVGYWAARGLPRRAAGLDRVRARGAARRAAVERLAAPVTVAAGLVAGLVALPVAIGLPPAYAWEWAGAGAGLAVGGAAGLASRCIRSS